MANREQKQMLRLKIDSIGINGEGIAHCDAQTFFVPHALPDEEVLVQTDYKKQGLTYCKLVDVIKSSVKRITPICEVFGSCGGCVFQHTDYESALRFKKMSLVQTLGKIAGYHGDVDDVVPSEPNFYYRNKLQLPFGESAGRVVLGFYREGTHEVVPTLHCPLHGVWAEKLIACTLIFANESKLSAYNEVNGKGLLRHLVARKLQNSICITVVINGDKLPMAKKYYDLLKESLEGDISLYISSNTKPTNVIMGDDVKLLFGGNQSVNIMGIDISVNPFSFFQINDNVREKVYKRIIAFIMSNGKPTVIDAYSGVGLLGAVLAKAGAEIHNIEIIPEAVSDAEKLYLANGLHAENILGDSAEVLPKLLLNLPASSRQNLTIFIDPPRKGCDDAVLQSIIDIGRKADNLKLIYLSCNPATLARDLKCLSVAFDIESITPYDMFSMCKGLETLVFLSVKHAAIRYN